MIRTRYAKPALFLVLVLLVVYTLWVGSRDEGNGSRKSDEVVPETAVTENAAPKEEIVIVVVVCGMRLDETLTMLKSALLFNVDKHPLRFVIITEEQLQENFKEKLEDWLALIGKVFKYELMPLTFPKKNEKEWKSLFKPCAAQRLFLPVGILTGLIFHPLFNNSLPPFSPFSPTWTR